MKKQLLCLLIAALTLTVFSVSAFAAGEVTVAVNANNTSFILDKDETKDITLTFRIENTTGQSIDSLQFDVSIPTGFTYKSFRDLSGSDLAGYNSGSQRYVFSKGAGKSGSWDAFELVLTIDSTAVKFGSTSTIKLTGQQIVQFVGKVPGTLKCAPAAITVEHSDAAHTWQKVGESGADCTSGGTQAYKCPCGATKTEKIAPLGHLDLTAGDFTFDKPDANNAHAKIHVTCGRLGCKYYGGGSGIDLTEADAEVTVTRDAKGAACGQAGKITYTARLTIGGKLTKTGTAAVNTDAALKHTFEKTQVIWSDGKTVTGTKRCSLCGKEFKGTGEATTVTDVEATCTAPGKSHREATLTFTLDAPAAWNDADKTEAVTTEGKPDTIPATGHKYEAAKKVRVENGAAVYAIDCTRCKDHIEMMCGDMNNDASIDLRDVTALFNQVRGNQTYPVFEEIPDVNHDGSVDAQDTTWLFDYVLGSKHTLG